MRSLVALLTERGGDDSQVLALVAKSGGKGTRQVCVLVLGLSALFPACAGTLSFAVGDGARAAIAAQPTCPAIPEASKVTTERTEDHAIAADIRETSTTERTGPVVMPPAHESEGASISEVGGGIIQTALGFIWSGLKWVVGAP